MYFTSCISKNESPSRPRLISAMQIVQSYSVVFLWRFEIHIAQKKRWTKSKQCLFWNFFLAYNCINVNGFLRRLYIVLDIHRLLTLFVRVFIGDDIDSLSMILSLIIYGWRYSSFAKCNFIWASVTEAFCKKLYELLESFTKLSFS